MVQFMRMNKNPAFMAVACDAIPVENLCNEGSDEWCIWDGSQCVQNYDSILFVSTLDLVLFSRGLITYFILCGCMIVYWFSGILVNKLKLFKRVASDKLDKCQIYIFEFIGLSAGIAFVYYHNAYGPVFNPNNYLHLSPQAAMDITRSISGFCLLGYMYAVEMITNELRPSLLLHHAVTIFIGCFFQFLMNDFVDFAALRCTMAMTLYAFTELNVFVQLLLYRIYPLFSWRVHCVSTAIYVLTRLLAIFVVCWTYYDWVVSDEIHDQLHGIKAKQYAYLTFFFVVPFANFLLNLAQYQTVKALVFLTLSVRKRIKQRNELRKYPRLQTLYDIFIEFDTSDNGYWTMIDWKKFIFYHSTFIKHDTCIILWNVLGFQYDEPRSQGLMAQISALATPQSRESSSQSQIDFQLAVVSEEVMSPTSAAKTVSPTNEMETEASVSIETPSDTVERLESRVVEMNGMQQLKSISIVSPSSLDVFTTDLYQDDDLPPERPERRATLSAIAIAEFETSARNKGAKQSPVPKAAIKKAKHMRWKHFRKIFGAHVKSKKYENYTVQRVISAQIQLLLQTIFSAQSQFEQYENAHQRRDTMKKLYFDINDLIGDKKTTENFEKYIKNENDEMEMSYDERLMDRQLKLDSLVIGSLQQFSSV